VFFVFFDIELTKIQELNLKKKSRAGDLYQKKSDEEKIERFSTHPS
jgi:hypothetical protein